MMIGFTGTDSVGKSTLVDDTVRTLRERGQEATIVTTGDIARHSPHPVVELQTAESSIWILDRLREAAAYAQSQSQVVICDRTPLDVLVYSHLSHSRHIITERDYQNITARVIAGMSDYSSVFIALIDERIGMVARNLPHEGYGDRDAFVRVLVQCLSRVELPCSVFYLPHDRLGRLSMVMKFCMPPES